MDKWFLAISQLAGVSNNSHDSENTFVRFPNIFVCNQSIHQKYVHQLSSCERYLFTLITKVLMKYKFLAVINKQNSFQGYSHLQQYKQFLLPIIVQFNSFTLPTPLTSTQHYLPTLSTKYLLRKYFIDIYLENIKMQLLPNTSLP